MLLQTFGFGDVLTNTIEYTDIPLSDVVAFRDNLYVTDDDRILGDWGTEYVWDGYSTECLEWLGDFFRTRPGGEYLTFQRTIFDVVSFNDVLSYVKQLINDTELYCWDYTDVWNEYSWDDSGLVDLEKLITLFDSIGFNELVMYVYVIGKSSEDGFAWGNDGFWVPNPIR